MWCCSDEVLETKLEKIEANSEEEGLWAYEPTQGPSKGKSQAVWRSGRALKTPVSCVVPGRLGNPSDASNVSKLLQTFTSHFLSKGSSGEEVNRRFQSPLGIKKIGKLE
jgi:hypothetical protein